MKGGNNVTSKRFATIYCIITAILCVATVLSLVLSNCISSSADLSDTLKTVLTALNFLPPILGICAMVALIVYRSKRIKTNF